jgi:hypothetical protein
VLLAIGRDPLLLPEPLATLTRELKHATDSKWLFHGRRNGNHLSEVLTARLPVARSGHTSTDRREAQVSCWASARASAVGALPTTVGNTEDGQ